MSKYIVKSKIHTKKLARKKKKRKKALKAAAIVICIAAVAFAVIAGICGGLKISRDVKYPVAYSEYITKYAKENDLDPYLVIAVIKQESNFVPDAQSAYAGGLMQLTEETAADYAAKMGLDSYDYMNPETNIRIGCRVLKTLIDKYDGAVDTALAAYNAGSGNVDSWLKNSNYSKDGVSLDYIPFSETRNYVEKIEKYVREYREHITLET